MSSKIEQLKREIDLIGDAMRLGLCGVSSGAARHQFIMNKHVELHNYQEELASYIGTDASIEFLAEAYERITKG